MTRLRGRESLKRLGRWIIILFCVWHGAAVAAMTIPPETVLGPLAFYRDYMRPVTDPYLYWTSQWQRWNLFAPNPTNWISEHRMEAFTGTGWTTLKTYRSAEYPAWRQSDELKLMDILDDANGEPARARFLLYECVEAGVPEGTTVQLVLRSRTLEREAKILIPSDWTEETIATVFCPAAL